MKHAMHFGLRQLANSVEQQTCWSRRYSRRRVAQYALTLRRPKTSTGWKGCPTVQQMLGLWDEAVKRGLDPRVYAVLVREGVVR